MFTLHCFISSYSWWAYLVKTDVFHCNKWKKIFLILYSLRYYLADKRKLKQCSLEIKKSTDRREWYIFKFRSVVLEKKRSQYIKTHIFPARIHASMASMWFIYTWHCTLMSRHIHAVILNISRRGGRALFTPCK